MKINSTSGVLSSRQICKFKAATVYPSTHEGTLISSDALYAGSLSGRLPSCIRLAHSYVGLAEDGCPAVCICDASAVGQHLEGLAGWSSRWMPALCEGCPQVCAHSGGSDQCHS